MRNPLLSKMKIDDWEIGAWLEALFSEDGAVRLPAEQRLRDRFPEIFGTLSPFADFLPAQVEKPPWRVFLDGCLLLLLVDLLFVPITVVLLLTSPLPNREMFLPLAGILWILILEVMVCALWARSYIRRRPERQQMRQMRRMYAELVRHACEQVEDPGRLEQVMCRMVTQSKHGTFLRDAGHPLWTALCRLLPRITADQAELINKKYRSSAVMLLAKAHAYSHKPAVGGLLQAVGRVGDRSWDRAVRVLTNPRTRFPKELREAAASCLAAMEARFAKEEQARTMLRAADRPATGQELLRPHEGRGEEEAARLLRPE